MSAPELVDVLIVGSGPSGISTALHLVRRDPAWAGRVVVVDKAVHPREKLCGGGLTHIGQNILANLGLALEPRNFPVNEVRLLYRNKSYSFYGNPVFRIVRRDEFDHWLVKTAEQLGVTVRQGEGVTAHNAARGVRRGRHRAGRLPRQSPRRRRRLAQLRAPQAEVGGRFARGPAGGGADARRPEQPAGVPRWHCRL